MASKKKIMLIYFLINFADLKHTMTFFTQLLVSDWTWKCAVNQNRSKMACGVRFLHGCEVTVGNQGQTFLDADGDQKESAFPYSSLCRRSIYQNFASYIKRNGRKTCRTRHGPNLTFSCAQGLVILIFLCVAIPIIGVRDQVVFLGGWYLYEPRSIRRERYWQITTCSIFCSSSSDKFSI